MKIRMPAFTPEIEAMLDQREIDVDCWQCGNTTPLTLVWVSTHRDMCCVECGNLIILNTSRLQSEVARLRRQLGALYSQMSGVLADVGKIGRRPVRRAQANPQFKPALAASHPARTGSKHG